MDINFLGLMYKANKLLLGRSAVKMALDNGTLKLIITAKDLSPRYKNDLVEKAFERNIKIVEKWKKRDIGKLFGKDEVGIIGITDKNIADKVIKGVS